MNTRGRRNTLEVQEEGGVRDNTIVCFMTTSERKGPHEREQHINEKKPAGGHGERSSEGRWKGRRLRNDQKNIKTVQNEVGNMKDYEVNKGTLNRGE